MEYTLILNGKDEFFPKLNNKKYNILLVDDVKKIEFMINFFDIFIKKINNNIKKKYYLGMDFEFNGVSKAIRNVALFQIILDSDDMDDGTIFVFYPPELNKNQTDILISLLTNQYIIKILHGGESLDIPYLFDQLLKTKKLIHKFCKNLFDTKYLCEYTHIEKNVTKKCSIYYLLEEYNIITHKKFMDLESIEEKTGPIYLIKINIHKLNFDVFRYSLYDVLFLPELIKKFLVKSSVYTKLIPEISHIVFQYKRNIESNNFSFNKIKEIVSTYNNYFIENKISLNEIYQYYWFTLDDNKQIWNNINQITYFRDFCESLFKFLVYYKISNKQDVFISVNKKAEPIKNINFNYYKELSNIINIVNKHLKD